MSAESSRKVRKSSMLFPLRAPFLEWQGKLMEALVRRAGLSRLRRCRTASGYGLDSKTATAGYTALCLPYFPANPFPGGLVDSQPRPTLSTGSTRATYAPGTSFLGSSGRGNRASAAATTLQSSSPLTRVETLSRETRRPLPWLSLRIVS